MWEVLESTRKLSEDSFQVQIDKQAIIDATGTLQNKGVQVPAWDCFYHWEGSDEKMVSYLLILDSINFCFWPEKGKAKWEIEYRSRKISGYYAMAASIGKAIESGVPLTRADYLAQLSLNSLKDILGGADNLQLLEDRLNILNEVGKVLLGDYEGSAGLLIEAAGKSALRLVRLLAEKFPSFRDVANYRGNEVLFYKRAQILAADLYGAFGGKDEGNFMDIDQLTCFADYKLPQVLRHLGILRYSSFLSKKIDQNILLKQGDLLEIEIRANTIFAVELMRQEFSRLGREIRAFEIDWILWNMGQDAGVGLKPYHRTLTTFY